jgi:sugar-phosphatase
MIHELVNHFDLTKYFDVITSADAVELGKPHPAVFLHCAAALGSRPTRCLVFEDSINGMIAAKAARMKVIVVPDQLHFDDPRFSIADGKLQSLEHFDMNVLRTV